MKIEREAKGGRLGERERKEGRKEGERERQWRI